MKRSVVTAAAKASAVSKDQIPQKRTRYLTGLAVAGWLAGGMADELKLSNLTLFFPLFTRAATTTDAARTRMRREKSVKTKLGIS